MSFDPSGGESAFPRYKIQGRAVTLPVEVR